MALMLVLNFIFRFHLQQLNNRHFLNWTTSTMQAFWTSIFFYIDVFYFSQKYTHSTCLCSRTKSIQFVLITNVRVNVCLHGILISCYMVKKWTCIRATFFCLSEKMRFKKKSFVEVFLSCYDKMTYEPELISLEILLVL